LVQRATKQPSRPKRTARTGPRKSAVSRPTAGKPTTTKPPAKRRSKASANGARYWSGRVTRESDALDLDSGVFTWSDPKRIAASLRRSALASHRRKADPYRSALSMLVFYINRAGKNLPARRRRTLDRAKAELGRLFGRG
jgi:hypothetical protein